MNKAKRDLIYDTWGDKCVLCGKKTRSLITHNIHGEPHVQLSAMSMKVLRNLTENGASDFIKLCRSCHHKAHKYLKLLKTV